MTWIPNEDAAHAPTACRSRASLGRLSPLLISIDPGPERSGVVVWSSKAHIPILSGWELNRDVVKWLDGQWRWSSEPSDLEFVAEDFRSYGKPVGASTFTSCQWLGAFRHAFAASDLIELAPTISAPEVTTALCGHTGGKPEAGTRKVTPATKKWHAILERYGGRELAIGGKLCQRCKGKGRRGRGLTEKQFGATPPDPAVWIYDHEKQLTYRRCELCKGARYETPRGPLWMLNSHPDPDVGHVRAALAHGIAHHERTTGERVEFTY